MFAPHNAKIDIQRSEPDYIDIDSLSKLIQQRNQTLAYTIVMRDLLKKKPADPEKSRDKIMRLWEADERLKALKPFVDCWNKWRDFYTDSEMYWLPKTPGQLTAIENILDLAKETGIPYEDLISCSFKAYSFEWRKNSLGLNMVLANGVEHVKRFKADVDLDYEKNHHFGTVGGAGSDFIDMEDEYDDL